MIYRRNARILEVQNLTFGWHEAHEGMNAYACGGHAGGLSQDQNFLPMVLRFTRATAPL